MMGGSKDSSNAMLFLSVIAAAAIIAAALWLRSGDTDTPDPSQPFKEKLVVPAEMIPCKQGERCIVVESHCGFCCDYTAINGALGLTAANCGVNIDVFGNDGTVVTGSILGCGENPDSLSTMTITLATPVGLFVVDASFDGTNVATATVFEDGVAFATCSVNPPTRATPPEDTRIMPLSSS